MKIKSPIWRFVAGCAILGFFSLTRFMQVEIWGYLIITAILGFAALYLGEIFFRPG